MKRIIIVCFLLLLGAVVDAQEIIMKYDSYGSGYGLYNDRTSRFVDKNRYAQYLILEMSESKRFFGVRKNRLWGVINESGKLVFDFQFDDIRTGHDGFYSAKKNGSWGVIDGDGHVLEPFNYQSVIITSYYAYCEPWRGESIKIDKADLMSRRQELNKQDLINQLRVDKEAKAAEERAQKVEKLTSFEKYAKSFVEGKFNKWQRKGEFEKLRDYRVRITGPSRTAMIDSLTAVVEENYMRENVELYPITQSMTLGEYDSEKESFPIVTRQYGTIIVPVPISEAQVFKSHFPNLKRLNADYVIYQDKFTLSALDFYDDVADKHYPYVNYDAISQAQHADNIYYTFDLINIETGEPVIPQKGRSSKIKRPEILLPQSRGSYSSEIVLVFVQASVFDKSVPTLHFWIDGKEAGYQIKEQKAIKGKSNVDCWVALNLPTENVDSVRILASVTDASGFSSENASVVYEYVK